MVYNIGEKKLMRIKKITAKWLKEREACGKGLNWFKRSYPNGLILTKRNINGFVGKLLNRRKEFSCQDAITIDTREALGWILDEIIDKNKYWDIDDLDEKKITQKNLTEMFWENYKAIN